MQKCNFCPVAGFFLQYLYYLNLIWEYIWLKGVQYALENIVGFAKVDTSTKDLLKNII